MLVYGHSIVRRFGDYVRSGKDWRMRTNLNLTDMGIRLVCTGDGGKKVSALAIRDLSYIRQVGPKLLILMMGGNDIDFDTVPEELAARLESWASLVASQNPDCKVFVCKVLPRYGVPRFLLRRASETEKARLQADYVRFYNSTAAEVNSLLAQALRGNSRISFWDHDRLFKQYTTRQKFGCDGIHLSGLGQWHLYRSLRFASLSALK